MSGGELDLGQNDSGEHDGAANVLPHGHLLLQDDGTGDNGEHALQTQQNGDNGGVGVLLGQNLKRVAHAAGEDAHVQQGQGAAEDGGEVHVLKNEHADGGDDAGEQELQTAELHAVAISGEVVDDQNVDGEAHRAHQDQQVAGGQREVALDAQQVQSHHGQHHGDPGGKADLALEEQTEHGDQYHIQRRDEAGLTGIGAGHQTRLLKVGGNGQRRTAAQAAQPQLLVGGLLLLSGEGGLVFLHLVADENDHQQGQHGDKVTGGVEGEGPDGVGAQVLRHEGGAPNERGKDREHYLTHLIVFHGSVSFLSL